MLYKYVNLCTHPQSPDHRPHLLLIFTHRILFNLILQFNTFENINFLFPLDIVAVL